MISEVARALRALSPFGESGCSPSPQAMPTLMITPFARTDTETALVWCESQRAGLGKGMRSTLEVVCRYSDSGPAS
jgi:hypothetical protein